MRRNGRVEDGRGSLGHAATLRFPSPLIEPDVRISRIRLSDWLHHEAHERITDRKRHVRGVLFLRQSAGREVRYTRLDRVRGSYGRKLVTA